MRRFRYSGGLGKPYSAINRTRSRGGSWSRKALQHKAINLQCAYCGSIANIETDHIVPLHKGGTDDWSNLQSLCHECHARKSAKERGA